MLITGHKRCKYHACTHQVNKCLLSYFYLLGVTVLNKKKANLLALNYVNLN